MKSVKAVLFHACASGLSAAELGGDGHLSATEPGCMLQSKPPVASLDDLHKLIPGIKDEGILPMEESGFAPDNSTDEGNIPRDVIDALDKEAVSMLIAGEGNIPFDGIDTLHKDAKAEDMMLSRHANENISLLEVGAMKKYYGSWFSPRPGKPRGTPVNAAWPKGVPYFLSDGGKSCNEACRAKGQLCDALQVSQVGSSGHACATVIREVAQNRCPDDWGFGTKVCPWGAHINGGKFYDDSSGCSLLTTDMGFTVWGYNLMRLNGRVKCSVVNPDPYRRRVCACFTDTLTQARIIRR